MRHALLLAGAVAALAGACADPVHDDEVAALGPEPAGETPGPLHRAGQPCLVCHGGAGPASGVLVFGGTIYESQLGPATPLVGGRVTMTDANGKIFQGATNAVGNFYVPAQEGTPAFPAMAALSLTRDGTTLTQSMSTFMGRSGSCATCHLDPESATSAGRVWLVTDPSALPAEVP